LVLRRLRVKEEGIRPAALPRKAQYPQAELIEEEKGSPGYEH
jgi:hypothetical protein